MKRNMVYGLIAIGCLLGGESVRAETVEKSTPWHIINIPGLNAEINLKNYFDRLRNYGIGVITREIEGLDTEGIDRVLGELGLPDVGTISDDLIGRATTEIEEQIFGSSSPSSYNFGNYTVAMNSGQLETITIQKQIIEAELSRSAQNEQILELEQIGELVQNTIDVANGASNSNISQDALKAIAAQNVNQAVLLQQIHKQNVEEKMEQKQARHTLLKLAFSTEEEKLLAAIKSNNEFVAVTTASFEFSALNTPYQ